MSVIEAVNRRTQLAGQNRLELLLFSAGSTQAYGINVFKVREIIKKLPLHHMPKSHRYISGICNIRGQTIPIIDLALVLNHKRVEDEHSFIIVTEYNRTIQGFLVSGVDKIINTNWEAVKSPPAGIDNSSYLTSVTHVEDEIVEIIDVEKIIQEICPRPEDISEGLKEKFTTKNEILENKVILVCDDSHVARKQITKTLGQIAAQTIVATNGKEMFELLKSWIQEGENIEDKVLMLISDIEMPEMDGYKLTTEIRKHPQLKELYVILHTSLSGVFNDELVRKVGANAFIPKFEPDTIINQVYMRLEQLLEQKGDES